MPEDSNTGPSPNASPSREGKSKEDCEASLEQQERFERARRRKEAKLEQARERAATRGGDALGRLYGLVGKETVLLPARPRYDSSGCNGSRSGGVELTPGRASVGRFVQREELP
jgi:hypothetical protein